MNTKTMQEIYFDLCDLIDSGQIDDIAISEPTPFETLRECLIEQRDKLHPFTIEREAEPAGGHAPDLLAALEALHSCHRAFSGNANWTALDDDARALAEAAIAKARGAQDHDENGICRHCGRDNEGHTHEPCSDDCPGRGA